MRNSKDANIIDIEFRMTSNLSLKSTNKMKQGNTNIYEKLSTLKCHVMLNVVCAHYLHVRLQTKKKCVT